MKKYFEEVFTFVNNRFYCGVTILTAVIAYGFSVTNISIGIDDIRGGLEIGEGRQVIASGRFSQTILPNFLGYHTEWIENSFAIDAMAVFLLILSATNCCILFRKKSKNRISMIALSVFSSLMLTYPLINEIFEYTHINLCICTGIFFSTLVIYIVDNLGEKEKTQWSILKMILVFSLMTFVCSCYESVVCVYIFLVFAILFLAILFEPDRWSIKLLIKTGGTYFTVLLSGIVGRIVIHKTIVTLFSIPHDTNGHTDIAWKINEVGSQLYSLLVSWFDMYLLKSIIYFPLTEMVIFGCVYICLLIYFLRCNKRYIIAVPGIGILLSLVVLSLLQGSVTFYRCTCQVFAFFIAFVGMMSCYVVQISNRRYVKNVVLLVLGWLCIVQSFNLNYWLTLNHLRSKEEERAICDIGSELRQNFDMNKPVVFCGYYGLSDAIVELASIPKNDVRWKAYSYVYSKVHDEDYSSIYNNASRKLTQTNVNSVISWALDEQKDMQALFAKQGFSIEITEDPEIWNEAFEKLYHGRVSGYPKKGYIEEEEEYIAVYIAKQN